MPEFRTRTRVKSLKQPVYADAFPLQPWVYTQRPDYEAGSMKPRVVRWNPSGAGPNAVLSANLDIMRRRSRERTRNDGTADMIIDQVVTDAVGVGIKPMFQTKDMGFNQALSELWFDWTEESDADGTLDFYGQQALALREVLEGAECFARLRFRRPEDGMAVPLQVQLLEGEYCPLDVTKQPLDSGARTIQGVAFNGFGRRDGYWLYRDHPGDGNMTLTRGGTQTSFVPADEIMHVRIMKRAGVVRGVPWLAQALIKLEALDKYDDAQLIRQQVATMFAGLVETDPAYAATFFPEQQADPGSLDAFLDLAPVTPASMQFLSPGQKMTWNQPPGPGSDYAAYMKHQERRVATAGKVLYEQASGDYSDVNDRTWRAAMLGHRRRIEMLQNHVLVFQLCGPTLRTWVDIGKLSGAIKPPAGIETDDIKRVLWVADRWDYINPVQDIAAEAAEMRAGLTSRKIKVSERGDDIERLDREIADDQARETDLDLVFDSNASHSAAPILDQAAPTEPEEPPSRKPPKGP